ncbi:MAG: hypothetical protein ABIV06_13940 [Thermoanaerobaculia bacterium]
MRVSAHRALILALAFCVTGLVAMPALQLATDRFDWRRIQVSYLYIFANGFETGLGPWSLVVGGTFATARFAPGSAMAAEIADTLAADGSCFVPARLFSKSAEIGESLLVQECSVRSSGDRITVRFRRPVN